MGRKRREGEKGEKERGREGKRRGGRGGVCFLLGRRWRSPFSYRVVNLSFPQKKRERLRFEVHVRHRPRSPSLFRPRHPASERHAETHEAPCDLGPAVKTPPGCRCRRHRHQQLLGGVCVFFVVTVRSCWPLFDSSTWGCTTGHPSFVMSCSPGIRRASIEGDGESTSQFMAHVRVISLSRDLPQRHSTS